MSISKNVRVFLNGAVALAVLAASTGCASKKDAKVSGKVLLESMPVTDAEVVFYQEGVREKAFFGRTGEDGTFTIKAGAAGKGPPPGNYKVAVSRYLQRDGKAPSANDLLMMKMGGQLRNSLPGIYELPAQSPLNATLTSGANQIELVLKKKP